MMNSVTQLNIALPSTNTLRQEINKSASENIVKGFNNKWRMFLINTTVVRVASLLGYLEITNDRTRKTENFPIHNQGNKFWQRLFFMELVVLWKLRARNLN